MSALIGLSTIVIASLVLIKSVELLVNSSWEMARRFRVSDYAISFFLVAIATSLPEIVVGITAAMSKNSILSFGNAIGSNVALVTLIIAIPVLINSGISTRILIHTKDAYVATIFSVLPLALIFDGNLSRFDGGILLALYGVYMFFVLRRGDRPEEEERSVETVNLWRNVSLFIFSLLLLFVASEAIVRGALSLSASLNLNLGFVGLTITAIGTSLPEIAFAIGVVRTKHQFEVLGNAVGSVVANSTVVLGLTAIVEPIVLTNSGMGFSSLLFSVFAALLFLRFVRTKESISTGEALILLLVYALFVAAEYYLR